MQSIKKSFEKLLNVNQVAERCGVSKRTIWYHCEAGKLPFLKFGPRIVRFVPEDVEAYLKKHRIG